MVKYKIPVVTRLQDNGDGGYTMFVYNTMDEMFADHPKSLEWNAKLKKEVPVILTQEQKDEILNEEDPYENGYMGKDTIYVEMVDGKMRLAKPMSFSAGQ